MGDEQHPLLSLSCELAKGFMELVGCGSFRFRGSLGELPRTAAVERAVVTLKENIAIAPGSRRSGPLVTEEGYEAPGFMEPFTLSTDLIPGVVREHEIIALMGTEVDSRQIPGILEKFPNSTRAHS